MLAAKTEFKTIASKIIQHPAVTIDRIKRRRVIDFSVQTTIGRGRRPLAKRRPLIARVRMARRGNVNVGPKPRDCQTIEIQRRAAMKLAR
jgi:hypothetical protein